MEDFIASQLNAPLLSFEQDIGGSEDTFERTSFESLDNEHAEMFDLLTSLIEKTTTHFKHEEELYEKGLEKLAGKDDHQDSQDSQSSQSSRHHDTKEMWATHKPHHAETLKARRDLKEGLIAHIRDEDVPQFHFSEHLSK